jgi:hypothetical protein
LLIRVAEDLGGRLAGVMQSTAAAPVIGVVGGCGGVGASRFAAVLATVAARAHDCSVLVDLDPMAGGIDVLLGIEAEPGPRWSGLHLAGGRLDPAELVAGLPAWGSVAVLAADGVLPLAASAGQLIGVAAQAGPVVLDLSRTSSDTRAAALEQCALVVLVAACDVGGVSGARQVCTGLGDVPVGVLARGGRTSAARAAQLIGARLIARVPARRGREDEPLSRDGSPRSMRRAADGVLAAIRPVERTSTLRVAR